LKKARKKFRNIYHGPLVVHKKQTLTDSSLTKLTIQDGGFKDLCQTYRNLISDLRIFDCSEQDQIIEQAQSENFPIVSAKAWAVAEPKKGVIMHGKDQTFQREMASMTKIMTAYTVIRLMNELNMHHPQNVFLRVPKKAAQMIGTTAFLRQDQRISIYDCLHGLLLPSGNDAAIVLAIAFGKWLFFANDKQPKIIQPAKMTNQA